MYYLNVYILYLSYAQLRYIVCPQGQSPLYHSLPSIYFAILFLRHYTRLMGHKFQANQFKSNRISFFFLFKLK